MIRLFYLMAVLSIFFGCAASRDEFYAAHSIAKQAFARGDFLEAAIYQMKTAEAYPNKSTDSGWEYCWAGTLFVRADKLPESEAAARRGLTVLQGRPIDEKAEDKVVKPGEEFSKYELSVGVKESGIFSCKMVLAQVHAKRGEWDPVRSLGKEYLTSGRLVALASPHGMMSFENRLPTFQELDGFTLAKVLQGKDPRLAAGIRVHLLDTFPRMTATDLSNEYSSLGKEYAALGDTAMAEKCLHRAEVIRQVEGSSEAMSTTLAARKKAEQYRALGYPERANLLEKLAPNIDIAEKLKQEEGEKREQSKAAARERKAQEAREAAAKREQVAREEAAKQAYERQHPEIAGARQAQEAAERQCADCKSSCDTQALTCTTACFGNLKDAMCSVRCQAAQESCKGGCEQRRDAQIAQAGGAPIGSSSSSGFMQGLVAVADGMAAAKGISPAGTVGRPSSSQVGLTGLAQALSAMAGGNGAVSGVTPLAGGQCDDSSEVREVEAITKRAAVETKGMGIERLQCYTAQQYVRIAQLQVRAATRCNVHMAESQAELQNMQAQSRKLCQGINPSADANVMESETKKTNADESTRRMKQEFDQIEKGGDGVSSVGSSGTGNKSNPWARPK
jgi:hypothetical protein